MADKVHPSIDIPIHSPPPSKPAAAAPNTYIIQLPKDQIYRHPPPENAERFKKLSKLNRRSSNRCCRCFKYTLAAAILLLLLLGIAAAVFYLVYKPESPNYTVDSIAITGFNLTSRRPISPEFDVVIRAKNPNDKIGIYYEKKSSVQVYFSEDRLSAGVLPVFYQPVNNVTVFKTAVRGNNIVLSRAVHSQLLKAQTEKKVALRLNLKAPIRIKVGGVKTWTIKVKVKCDITVDSLTAKSKIVWKHCDYSAKLW
ncbi:Harpin-induced family protein [Heracleum sosnowskyi]|uniref:Harpin-induced family protein n=1 Tax=Heracleum sosnowskyi TaxID=360622 RepID=A0AAD8J5K8_9APIA|nr:Harpin-induced family protein [Heracleum sosnowskyi]